MRVRDVVFSFYRRPATELRSRQLLSVGIRLCGYLRRDGCELLLRESRAMERRHQPALAGAELVGANRDTNVPLAPTPHVPGHILRGPQSLVGSPARRSPHSFASSAFLHRSVVHPEREA